MPEILVDLPGTDDFLGQGGTLSLTVQPSPRAPCAGMGRSDADFPKGSRSKTHLGPHAEAQVRTSAAARATAISTLFLPRAVFPANSGRAIRARGGVLGC